MLHPYEHIIFLQSIIVPVLASATILTCLLGLVIGIQLGFVGGVYKKVKEKNITNPTSHADRETITEPSPEAPVHEYIQMKQNLSLSMCLTTILMDKYNNLSRNLLLYNTCS